MMNWGTLPQECPSLIPFLTFLETQAISEPAQDDSAAGDPIWPAWVASRLEEAGLTVTWPWYVDPKRSGKGATYASFSSIGNIEVETSIAFDPAEAIEKGGSAGEVMRQGVFFAWTGDEEANVNFSFTILGERAHVITVDVDRVPGGTTNMFDDRQYDVRRLFEVMLTALKEERNVR